ncbi:MAG: aldehyde dehydrogenase family protein, partial [Rikenellaceae bacterium]
QRYDYIFYTGSENFGREVMSRAAQRLIPVTLELGGKSPVIVNSDADLRSAARRIVWGKLLNAGQTCVAPDYMFVHEDVCDELISMMIREIETRYAIPIKKCAEYGRLISEDHTLRAQEMIQEVRSKVIYGGDVDIKERYVAPTLVVNPPINSKVMQEEIFAPILPIITYNTLSQPIEHIRCNPHPLALYYFGASKKDINNILNFTTSGGVCINDTIMQVASSQIAFGGVGSSGMGRYHGYESFNTFSHQRSVVKSFAFELKLKYPPYKNRINLLRKLR